MRGFKNLIGTEAKINFFCPPGLELTKVFGKEIEGNGFKIGDLRKNDILNYFIEFKVDPKFMIEGESECFYTLLYKNVSNKEDVISKGSCMKIGITEEEVKLNETNKEVVKLFEVWIELEKQKEAHSFLEKGKHSESLLLLDSALLETQEISKTLENEENKELVETAVKRLERTKKRIKSNPSETKSNMLETEKLYLSAEAHSHAYSEL